MNTITELLSSAIDWRPIDGEPILIAIDERDIDTARVILADLPESARGTVFVSVPTDDDVATLPAPPRFAVHWLVRERGQSLQRAVDAHLAEQVPSEPCGSCGLYAWIAARGASQRISS